MSALPTSPFESDDGDAADGRPSALRRVAPGSFERVGPALSKGLRGGAFWLAVMLPFLHVPLLATGIDTGGERGALALLLGLNAAALYLGRGYGSE